MFSFVPDAPITWFFKAEGPWKGRIADSATGCVASPGRLPKQRQKSCPEENGFHVLNLLTFPSKNCPKTEEIYTKETQAWELWSTCTESVLVHVQFLAGKICLLSCDGRMREWQKITYEAESKNCPCLVAREIQGEKGPLPHMSSVWLPLEGRCTITINISAWHCPSNFTAREEGDRFLTENKNIVQWPEALTRFEQTSTPSTTASTLTFLRPDGYAAGKKGIARRKTVLRTCAISFLL